MQVISMMTDQEDHGLIWGRVGGGVGKGSAQKGLEAWGCLKRPGLPLVTDVNIYKNYDEIGPSGSRHMGEAGLVIAVGVGVKGLAGSLFWASVDGIQKKGSYPNPVNGGWQIALVTLTVANLSVGRQLRRSSGASNVNIY